MQYNVTLIRCNHEDSTLRMLKVYYYRVYLAEALLDDPNHNFWLEVC